MNFDRNSKIAFLGMGLMGSRMAARLIQAGFDVAVWNRTATMLSSLDVSARKAIVRLHVAAPQERRYSQNLSILEKLRICLGACK